jgi:thiosulfate dehydrogenase
MVRVVLTCILVVLSVSAYGITERGDGTDLHSPLQHPPEKYTEQMRISRGGQLYDNWLKTTVDTEKPEGDHPLWKEQSTNKRSGYSTYRCKECHGWDYLGKDGAYGKGSHYTGFSGVYEASQNMTINELQAALRGSTNGDHDFSIYINDDDVADLALFLKKGVIDIDRYVKKDGRPVDGDPDSGRDLFVKGCMIMCHRADGTAINFGKEEKPEFVGTVANKNPWEFVHKIRAGQPGTRMSSGIVYKWSEKDIRNVLAYSQTLPQKRTEPGWFERLFEKLGFGQQPHRSRILKEYRGFGPNTKYHGVPDE